MLQTLNFAPVPADVWRARVTHLATTDPELLRRLPVLLDMMAAAREDGTHALRSVQQTTDLLTAAGLQVTSRTVERHRSWAVQNNYAVVQVRGGRTSGATIYAATLPVSERAHLSEHPTPSRVRLSGDGHTTADPKHTTTAGVDMSVDAPEHPTSTRQAHDTATPEVVVPLMPVGPTSKQQRPEDPPMDDATWLAAELDADLTACRGAIEHKRHLAEQRGNPWRSPSHMVRNVIPWTSGGPWSSSGSRWPSASP